MGAAFTRAAITAGIEPSAFSASWWDRNKPYKDIDSIFTTPMGRIDITDFVNMAYDLLKTESTF